MKFKKEEFVKWAREYTDYNNISARAEEAFKGWSLRDPKTFIDNAREVIAIIDDLTDVVEKFCIDIDALSSKEKQKAVKEIIDDWIKLNTFLEWADDIAIDYLIAAVVETKNRHLGHDWYPDEHS